jgi:hypothetical protein
MAQNPTKTVINAMSASMSSANDEATGTFDAMRYSPNGSKIPLMKS